MEDIKKVDLLEYNYLLARVSPVTTKKEVATIADTLVGEIPEEYKKINMTASIRRGVVLSHKHLVDLSLVNPNNYVGNRWKSGTVPVLDDFIWQLENGTHPACTIGKIHEFNGGLSKYLNNKIMELREAASKLAPEETKETLTYTLHDMMLEGKLIPRFSACKTNSKGKKKIAETPELKRVMSLAVYLTSQIGRIYPSSILALKPTADSSEDKLDFSSAIVFNPPIPDKEKMNQLLKDSRASFSHRNSWNHDYPSEKEFEDTTEMYLKVVEHCKDIPGFQIISLRKRDLAYYSDGSYLSSPDAYPKTYKAKLENGYQVSGGGSPLLYAGEAWCLYFNVAGKDYLNGNHVYFATPDQYVAAYKEGRPDLVPEDWKPWSDLIWISSDWCERNRNKSLDSGINLSTPNTRRLSLFCWIVGAFLQHCIEHSLGNPFPGTILENKNTAKSRWDARKKQDDYKTELMSILKKVHEGEIIDASSATPFPGYCEGNSAIGEEPCKMFPFCPIVEEHRKNFATITDPNEALKLNDLYKDILPEGTTLVSDNIIQELIEKKNAPKEKVSV